MAAWPGSLCGCIGSRRWVMFSRWTCVLLVTDLDPSGAVLFRVLVCGDTITQSTPRKGLSTEWRVPLQNMYKMINFWFLATVTKPSSFKLWCQETRFSWSPLWRLLSAQSGSVINAVKIFSNIEQLRPQTDPDLHLTLPFTGWVRMFWTCLHLWNSWKIVFTFCGSWGN